MADYLTPYQRELEIYNLPERALDASAAASERRMAAEASNPLLAPRAGGLAPAATEVAPVSTEPNPMTREPLIRPPVPLSMMPIQQQVEWQALADQRMDREQKALAFETQQRDKELKAEEIRQSRAMMSEVPKLQQAFATGDMDKYLELRTDLIARHPAGAGSVEAQRALGSLDERYRKQVGFEEETNKAKIARRSAILQTRVEAGHKQAEVLGPEVQRQYAAAVEKDPEGAMQYLADIVGKARYESARTRLEAQGLTPQQIEEQYGTGAEFKYAAAENAAKDRAALTLERQRVENDLFAMHKQRMESKFDPAKAGKEGADPWAGVDLKKWDPQLEQIYRSKQQYVNSLTPQVTPGPTIPAPTTGARELKVPSEEVPSGNRAGVGGMPVGSARQQLAQQAIVQQPIRPAGSSLLQGQTQPLAALGPAAGRLATTMATVPARAVWAMATPEAERARQAAAQTVPTLTGSVQPAPIPVTTPVPQPVRQRQWVDPKTGETVTLVLRNGQWEKI